MSSKAIASGKVILIGSFLSRGITIISSIILARYLVEQDYGALVLSTIFAGFITQIGGMGYEMYYLQHKGSDEDAKVILDQVFNLRLITNSILFVVQSIIGLVLCFFYNDTVSGLILIMMSISLVIEGLNTPHETLLKKEMNFKKITVGNIYKELFTAAGKIGFAVAGFGGLCFGIGAIIGSIVRMIYLFKAQKYRPSYFSFNKPVAKKIFDFGKHVLVGSGGNYLVQQIDRIFLTSFYPKNIVGQYGFAWSNAMMPFSYLISPQGQVIMTYISQFSKGRKELFFKLGKIYKTILAVMIPLVIIAYINMNDIVQLVFGVKWIASSSLIKSMTIYFTLLSFLFPFNALVTCLGNPKLNSHITIVKAIILVSILFIYNFINTERNILVYASIFMNVSILFDLIKSFLGIKMTGLKSLEIFNFFKYDLLIFFGLYLLLYYIDSKNYSFNYRIVVTFITIITFVIFNLKTYNTLLNKLIQFNKK